MEEGNKEEQTKQEDNKNDTISEETLVKLIVGDAQQQEENLGSPAKKNKVGDFWKKANGGEEKMEVEEQKKFLVFTDLEPDDMAMLILLIGTGQARNVSVVIGKGKLSFKMPWLQRFFADFPEETKHWKVYRGTETNDSFPAFPGETAEGGETFTSEVFDPEIIKEHDVILSSKPVDELLALPDGTVFPNVQFWGTMSFNFRAASKKDTLDADAQKLISMFPSKFAWVESFPAIGSDNAGGYEFTVPLLRALQVEWNRFLLNDQLNKLSKRVDFDPATVPEVELRQNMAALKRSVKAIKSLRDQGDNNVLLVDSLLVPLFFLQERFPLTRVKFTGHNDAGYPQFEPSEEGNLFQARDVHGLRDFVHTCYVEVLSRL